jgi:hypothetical protein
VFFLGGFSSDPRAVTVAEGKALFFPLINGEWDNYWVPPLQFTIRELYQSIDQFVQTIYELHASVDGKQLKRLFSYRATSKPFSYWLPDSDIYDVWWAGVPLASPGGVVTPAVSDGYWIMLDPLPVGTHVVRFGGKSTYNGGFSVDAMYTVTVVPAVHGDNDRDERR